MKEHEGFSKGEELLAQALEECLEEDLSFVPPEGEIARQHPFSKQFDQEMQAFLDEASAHLNRKKIKRHFSLRYGQLAACLLVFVLCGSLFYHLFRTSFDNTMTSDLAASMEEASEAVEETEAGSFDEEGSLDTDAGEAVPEDAPAMGNGQETDETLAGGRTKEYCGRTVYYAKQQDVPDMLDGVTTLVNCPVLDEEHMLLYLTIGNTGEEDLEYWNRYDLEVWLEDGWYRIPYDGQSDGQWVTLEAGMAVDEEIDLTAYQIDGKANYRLLTYVGTELLSAEFTFEEIFTKTMEDLEDE